MQEQEQEQEQAKRSGVPTGWIVAVLLVVVAWAGACALRGGGNKEILPGWADGLSAGQQVAQETDKPMAVLFTAGWCPPCKQLKKDVLTKDAVNDALRAGFVPVQIDLTDQSANNPNLETAQQYGVQYIPTIIVMSPQGEALQTYEGEQASAWLNRLAE